MGMDVVLVSGHGQGAGYGVWASEWCWVGHSLFPLLILGLKKTIDNCQLFCPSESIDFSPNARTRAIQKLNETKLKQILKQK